MKTFLLKARPRSRARRGEAFTLVEMLVTVAIFALLLTAFIYAHIFGLRYDELVCSKLGASEQSRMSFELLTSDIRASKIWRIGNGSTNGFTNVPNATLMQGNAVQLSWTTDTNQWVRYYFETSGPSSTQPNGRLCRLTSDGYYDILAQFLTNASGTSMQFRAENYLGTQVTDYQYKYVIVALMEFYQYQFPQTYVGPGLYYDYYRIQLKATSHAFNGP
jgi:prepilin-type N-terminal cleavage/methylation domain-containing protein